jgi:hypothetical protein
MTKKEAIEKLVEVCRARDEACEEYNAAGPDSDISNEAYDQLGRRWDDLVREAEDLQTYIDNLDSMERYDAGFFG